MSGTLYEQGLRKRAERAEAQVKTLRDALERECHRMCGLCIPNSVAYSDTYESKPYADEKGRMFHRHKKDSQLDFMCGSPILSAALAATEENPFRGV